ncbi:farnesyl diphosphate synthase [Aquamicrobium lusatiense]|uniref:Probable farnesyl diphosphate synthase n=2 Tax=Aquamicrobium lusatiense TaxID=89772 RepID=A0A7W9VUB4_9HYPH|nr:farnesyl diphosphate synthase [Aquamicrobium lusatiense]
MRNVCASATAPGMENDARIRFETLLDERAQAVETLLRSILDQNPLPGEIVRPERLIDAMRHGALNGGKRLRPFLVIESAALFGAKARQPEAARVAAALECVHCYSLVHDDLPAMDDDDMRRGQPTVHKAFDEATAILAGDALLTLAFDILSDDAHDRGPAAVPPAARLALVRGLARASGPGGMVGGQMLDLSAGQEKPDEAGIIRLQAMKTGALFRYACEAGAIVAGAGEGDRERLAEFGSAIGLAFQLADDLLDLTADASQLGKATGKDAAAGKATLAALHGPDWARSQLHGLVEQASSLLEPFGENAAILRQAARFVAYRDR